MTPVGQRQMHDWYKNPLLVKDLINDIDSIALTQLEIHEQAITKE